MSIEAANRAIDRIEGDESFAERMVQSDGPEARLEILRSEGFDVTGQDMRDAALDRFSDTLTPEQLEQVAAGASGDGGIAGWGIFVAGAVIAAILA